MTRSLRLFPFVLAGTGSGAFPGSAFPPPPETDRIPFTVEQAASLTMPRYEYIVEAIVESAESTTVVRGEGCQWVTELQLRPVRQLRGVVLDETFPALTMSLPDSLPPPRGCAIGRLSGEVPPPRPGARGFFLLVGEKSPMRFIDNIPTLPSVVCNFWPMTPDGKVSACLMGSKYVWPHEDLVASFEHQATKLTVEATSKVASVVLLAHADGCDRMTSRFPLTVEHVYRGAIAAGTVWLNFEMGNEPRGPEGILLRDRNVMLIERLQQVLPSRLLVFAKVLGAGDLTPVGVGFLLVDGKQMVSLPQWKIEGGVAKPMTQSLSELEVLLR